MQETKKNSFFYSNVSSDYVRKEFLEEIIELSKEKAQHIYLINRPLSEKKYDYTVDKVLILLSPGYKMYFIGLDIDKKDPEAVENFEEIYEDFIEDLGHIADKYEYTDIISRPRKWKKFIEPKIESEFFEDIEEAKTLKEFFENNTLKDKKESRTVKLLISLLTGSINSVEKIGEKAPESILEKVKKNIVLFDGDQTRFIFDEDYKDNVIKIQGLAGTGKTELLLHRLKEIYVSQKDLKIAFTCQSKTLANILTKRVTEFFNFMKVEEQIEWGKRLWVMHAWGSATDRFNLGAYGMICRKFQLPFFTPSDGSFAWACKKTLQYIEEHNIKIDPLFDYMLIDEGQDFTEDFFKLCSLVTSKRVFIAGDIFQDIFGIQKVESQPHYLLNKCYRTDPRTLMFAHGLGLALFENPSLRFLKDNEWEACGYKYVKSQKNYILQREPVNRFEDISAEQMPTSIEITPYNEYSADSIVEKIHELKKDYDDLEAEDIVIIFPNQWVKYKKFDELEVLLYKEFNWESNILHNTKGISKGKINIANKNNIKGLEFPFVICVVDYEVTRDLKNRNTLYMSLTRSFLSSYLIIQNENNKELIQNLENGLKEINSNYQMTVPEPDEKTKERQQAIIAEYNKPVKNQLSILTEIFEELGISNRNERQFLRQLVSAYKPDETNKDELKAYLIMTRSGDNNETS
ncbi:DEAD/DEAH box helicase [Bacillus paramycoides]|uniref:DEAD/DEAH box helicase n=1 Tax=Bacillus paramycoides TaxID=2026194 RepID=UPI002E214168|nr:ATP-binding domain-containing protein [Bacillus paramycoides]